VTPSSTPSTYTRASSGVELTTISPRPGPASDHAATPASISSSTAATLTPIARIGAARGWATGGAGSTRDDTDPDRASAGGAEAVRVPVSSTRWRGVSGVASRRTRGATRSSHAARCAGITGPVSRMRKRSSATPSSSAVANRCPRSSAIARCTMPTSSASSSGRSSSSGTNRAFCTRVRISGSLSPSKARRPLSIS
jgi:hypothetical protein